jgi:hypothetical protein
MDNQEMVLMTTAVFIIGLIISYLSKCFQHLCTWIMLNYQSFISYSHMDIHLSLKQFNDRDHKSSSFGFSPIPTSPNHLAFNCAWG